MNAFTKGLDDIRTTIADTGARYAEPQSLAAGFSTLFICAGHCLRSGEAIREFSCLLLKFAGLF